MKQFMILAVVFVITTAKPVNPPEAQAKLALIGHLKTKLSTIVSHLVTGESNAAYFKKWAITPPDENLCKVVRLNTTSVRQERSSYLTQMCVADMYMQTNAANLANGLVEINAGARRKLEKKLKLAKSKAKIVDNGENPKAKDMKFIPFTTPTIINDDGSKVVIDLAYEMIDTTVTVAEDLEKGEFGKAAKAAFDWLFKSFKALIQPAPSPGMGKTVSSAGYSIATSYQTAIFLRNLIEVYKIDQAIDEIDETQLDFSNTVLKPGSITFEELSNLVKDANKRLEQTGQKVAVHEDDFFLNHFGVQHSVNSLGEVLMSIVSKTMPIGEELKPKGYDALDKLAQYVAENDVHVQKEAESFLNTVGWEWGQCSFIFGVIVFLAKVYYNLRQLIVHKKRNDDIEMANFRVEQT